MATHTHDHGHQHGHSHEQGHGTPEFADPEVPRPQPRPLDLRRRQFVQRLGLLGAAAGARTSGGTVDPSRYQWLAGDRHIHTQYSYDAMHTVAQQVAAGEGNGLDWRERVRPAPVPRHRRAGVSGPRPAAGAPRGMPGPAP